MMAWLTLIAGVIVVVVAVVFVAICMTILSGRVSRHEPLTPPWPWER